MLVESCGSVPTLSSFSEEGKLMRLISSRWLKTPPSRALSCYGLYLPELDET